MAPRKTGMRKSMKKQQQKKQQQKQQQKKQQRKSLKKGGNQRKTLKKVMRGGAVDNDVVVEHKDGDELKIYKVTNYDKDAEIKSATLVEVDDKGDVKNGGSTVELGADADKLKVVSKKVKVTVSTITGREYMAKVEGEEDATIEQIKSAE